MNDAVNKLPITLITTCKPFIGFDAVFQENALASWRRLGFDVIIIGNDEGTAQACAKHSITHVSTVRTGAKNLPLVPEIFQIGETETQTPYYAYINADITFSRNALNCLTLFFEIHGGAGNVLLTARRRNIPIFHALDFSNDTIDYRLKDIDHQFGTWDHPYAIDFFLLNKGWLKDIPDLMIGRAGWDNWMLKNAQQQEVDIIDATPQLTLYHPLHGYRVVESGLDNRLNDESLSNRRLVGVVSGAIDTCASHVMEHSSITPLDTLKRKQMQAVYSVDLEKLFVGDMLIYANINLQSAEEKINYLYTVIARSMRYFPQLLVKKASLSHLENLQKEIQQLSDEQNISKASEYLQDWLLSDFLAKTRQLNAVERPIVIWGAGQAGKRLCEFFSRHYIEISALWDSSIDQDTGNNSIQTRFGFPVKSPQLDTVNSIQKPFVVIASMYFLEISENLIKAGYKSEADFLY